MNIIIMFYRLLFVLLSIILSVSSIKVPVNNEETATERITVVQEEPQSTPVYYIKDNVNLDSYLVQPDNHRADESYPEGLETPATYLIPPVKEQQSQFYTPAEPSAQSDWLPILQAPKIQNQRNGRFQRPPVEPLPIFFNFNQPIKQQEGNQFSLPIPVPSTQLVPPAVDAVNEFFLPIPKEIEIHVDDQNQPIKAQNYNLPIYDDRDLDNEKHHLEHARPSVALHLTPPKQQPPFNIPTKLYPKKYSSEYKPMPIPLAQFSTEKDAQVPKAKPIKYFRPQPIEEIEQFKPSDEKNVYHFKKAENKRKLKGDEDIKEHHENAETETYGRPVSTEQETSETNFRYPGRNVYPALIRQAPAHQHNADPSVAPAPDGRTEFRMHGMKGPHSYQFGYDTGKGKNRQFRYEERDNDGLVHGHYGYVDKLGKLRVVNYSAHPEYGFRAEEPVMKEQ